MKATCLSIISGLWLFFAGPVGAQCPAGIPSAGNPQCIPPNDPGWLHNQPAQQIAPVQGPQWKLTWGAVAIDADTGDVGTSVGNPSKRAAEKVALQRCQVNGAKGCKRLMLAFQNQCGVIAWPGVAGQGALVTVQGGPSVEVATEAALRKCAGPGGGGGCRIVYSECSQPVLVN